MRNLLRQRLTNCLLALPLIVFSQAAFAASYSLPADIGSGAFSSCSGAGPSYTCSSNINLDNDTVTLTGNVTLVINGSLIIGDNVILSNGGFIFNINVNGNVTIDDDNTIGANLTVTGNFVADDNNSFTGDIDVAGNFVVDDGNSISGNVTAGGNIDIDDGNTITGDLNAGGNLNIDDNNIVNGNVTAGGNIDIDQNNIINGDIIAGGNLNIDNSTVVNGTCTPPHPVCTGPVVPPSGASATFFLSTYDNETLGGLSFGDDDLILYDAPTDTSTLVFDGGNIFSNGAEDIDAVHYLANGNIVLSTMGGANIGGLTITDGDMAEYDPVADTATLFFSESNFSGGADINAVYVRSDGMIILSTDRNETLGGLSFEDEDLVLYDPVTDTASLYLNGDNVFNREEDIDAVHVLSTGNIVLSTVGGANIGGLRFEDGDLVEYDPVAGSAQLYFDEGNFSNNADIGALHIQDTTFPLDHFNIIPATVNASTCLPNAITIIAENSLNNPVANYTNQIDITVSTNHGNWSINSANGVLSPNPDNDDNGLVSYTFVDSDVSQIVLNLSNTHAESLTITVADVVEGVTSTSVTITYSINIFIITEDPIQIAGRPQAMTIAMWTDDTAGSGSCGIDTNYNASSQSLIASIDRLGVLTAAADPTIGAVTIPDGPATAGLTFDFSITPGQASFNLDTTDVGQYTLTISDTTYITDPANSHSSSIITGTSSPLTVEPFGLAVTNIVAGATVNPGANTPGGAIFTTAGLDFSATVAAVLWDAADDTDNDGVLDAGVFADNPIAPSYAWDTTLSVSPIGFEPATGVPGSLNNGAILEAEFNLGTVTINDLQYTEVGSFTLQSQALDYLGDLNADIVGDPIIIGRFIPSFFQITVTDDGAIDNTCGVYTYIGEDFSYSTPPAFTVSAMNALPIPTVTQNYRDGYVKLNASSVTVDVSADTSVVGTDLVLLNVSYTPAPMIFTPNNDGTVDYTFGADTIRYGPDSVVLGYSKESNSEIVPFTADLDPVLTQITDLEVTTVFTQAFDLVGNQLRFGRIRLSNVFGSELIDLAMPMIVEYLVSPGVYSINSDDVCSTVANGDLVIIDNLSVPGSSMIAVTNPTAIAGDLGVTLTAPGAGIVGDINVSPDLVLSVEKWLRWDWNNTGQFDADPNATATFGIFSGNPVQIYIQQIYQ